MRLLLEFIIFLIVTNIFSFIIYLRLNKKNMLSTFKALNIIKKKYKLKLNKEMTKKLAIIISVINSFIISLTLSICLNLVNNYYVSLVVALIIYVVLILISYNLIGIILKKKGWEKNGNNRN